MTKHEILAETERVYRDGVDRRDRFFQRLSREWRKTPFTTPKTVEDYVLGRQKETRAVLKVLRDLKEEE